MKNIATIVAVTGLGAALGYYFDGDLGRRRRALARDRLIHVRRRAGGAAAHASRDVANRARDVVASARRRFEAGPMDDEVLAERVRAQLSYAVAHPRSIDVHARGGSVRLTGPVLAAEVSRLLARVARVRGVRRVDNRLTVYDDPTGAPGPPEALSPRRGAWPSPTARFVAGVLSTGAMMSALAWRRIASQARRFVS
jgi:hypothetical protein